MRNAFTPALRSRPSRLFRTPLRPRLSQPDSRPNSLASQPRQMSTSSSTHPWPSKPHTPRHSSLPYDASFFSRSDPSEDTDFYSEPRFVTHIDDGAIAALRDYYAAVLPRTGTVLDFCSSWTSHLPAELVERAKEAKARAKAGPEPAASRGDELVFFGTGLNAAELAANPAIAVQAVHDLNGAPAIPAKALGIASSSLDAATCVVSVDYLVQPVETLKSVRDLLKVGGVVHLVVSNRCFPTKAVRGWLEAGEEERLKICGDYLCFAGFREVEIVELAGGGKDSQAGGGGGSFGGLAAMMGMLSGGADPLWVVRGRKTAE